MAKEIAFTKVSLPYGWLGNMSPYPVTYNQLVFKTSEHLYQCLKLAGWPIPFEEVRTQLSPMAAKMVAKKYKQVAEDDPVINFDNMMLCLRLKLEQHPELQGALMDTDDAELIEDCTSRPHGTGLYWGAAKQANGTWTGDNLLGNAWMILRKELIDQREKAE